MIDRKDVTIIIPHLGETKEQHYAFNQCWISLRETVPDIKIIVAKNGKEFMGEPIPIDFYKYAEKIALSEQGQCKATNAAVATVSTPWVLVTNDDMIYPEGWWERLSWSVERNGNYFKCISPMLIEPKPGAPTFEVFFAGGTGGDFNKQKWNEFVDRYYVRQHLTIRDGFNLPFLIRRELWDIIGGYDINYDPWGSNGDSDLEYKIKLAGVQPKQTTEAIVYHFSQTSGTFQSENQSYWQKNWDYFIQKWGFPRTDEGIWEATFEIPEPPLRKFTPWWEGFYGTD